MRQADHILIIGLATADPAPGELETALLGSGAGRTRKRKSLVLLHRNDDRQPSGEPGTGWPCARWISTSMCAGKTQPIAGVWRAGWPEAPSVWRSAKEAARGFAHIGVIRALEEAGIPIDMVGGTSAGALIAAQCAMGWNAQRILDGSRTYVQAQQNDYTLPFVALLSGRRTSEVFQSLFGDIDIQDLWLPYFASPPISRRRPR